MANEAKTRDRFNELVVEHQSRIRSYLSSIGVAVSSIDDIAQEALVVAYRKFDNYEEGTSFPAWVNRIARNLAFNDQRKTSRRFKLLNERMTNFLDEQVSPEALDQDDGDDASRAALRECMQRLPDEHQTLIETRYQDELDSTEIAAKFDLKPNTVRQRLSRLRQALLECIRTQLGGMPE